MVYIIVPTIHPRVLAAGKQRSDERSTNVATRIAQTKLIHTGKGSPKISAWASADAYLLKPDDALRCLMVRGSSARTLYFNSKDWLGESSFPLHSHLNELPTVVSIRRRSSPGPGLYQKYGTLTSSPYAFLLTLRTAVPHVHPVHVVWSVSWYPLQTCTTSICQLFRRKHVWVFGK